MSSLYTDIIQHAYRYPAHRGKLETATHAHEDENPLCGDTLRVLLRVDEGRVVEARFQGRGCMISQASAELLLEEIEQLPVEDIGAMNKDIVLEALGLPTISPGRLKCALLSLEVVKGALRQPPIA